MKTHIDPATVISNWKETELLEDCHDPEGLALCLQSQIIFNDSHELTPSFKRMSIPIVVRLFRMSEAIKRNHFLNYFEEIAWPNVLMFKTKFKIFDGATRDEIESRKPSLQAEADYLESAVEKWAKELDEHFSDMNGKEVNFRGLGHLDDGTMLMYYS